MVAFEEGTLLFHKLSCADEYGGILCGNLLSSNLNIDRPLFNSFPKNAMIFPNYQAFSQSIYSAIILGDRQIECSFILRHGCNHQYHIARIQINQSNLHLRSVSKDIALSFKTSCLIFSKKLFAY